MTNGNTIGIGRSQQDLWPGPQNLRPLDGIINPEDLKALSVDGLNIADKIRALRRSGVLGGILPSLSISGFTEEELGVAERIFSDEGNRYATLVVDKDDRGGENAIWALIGGLNTGDIVKDPQKFNLPDPIIELKRRRDTESREKIEHERNTRKTIVDQTLDNATWIAQQRIENPGSDDVIDSRLLQHALALVDDSPRPENLTLALIFACGVKSPSDFSTISNRIYSVAKKTGAIDDRTDTLLRDAINELLSAKTSGNDHNVLRAKSMYIVQESDALYGNGNDTLATMLLAMSIGSVLPIQGYKPYHLREQLTGRLGAQIDSSLSDAKS